MILLLISCDFTPPIYKEIIRAQEFIKLQQFEAAIGIYQRILRDGTSSDEIKARLYYQIGDILTIYLGNHREAIASLAEIKKLNSTPQWQIKTEERIADIYYSYIKDYQAAIHIYKLLLEIRPKLTNYDLYLSRLAKSFMLQNKYDQALKYFEQLQGGAMASDALFNMALLHFYQKKWDRAIELFKQFIKNESSEDLINEAKFIMANIYETTEQLKESYNIYRSILGKHPNTEIIQQRLSSIYNRRIARKR